MVYGGGFGPRSARCAWKNVPNPFRKSHRRTSRDEAGSRANVPALPSLPAAKTLTSTSRTVGLATFVRGKSGAYCSFASETQSSDSSLSAKVKEVGVGVTKP